MGFEMMAGLPPFYSENVNEMYELILNKPLEFPKGFQKDAQDLITKLLVRNPAERLVDGEKIMAHDYFKPIDWDKLLKKELKPQWVPDLSGDAEKYVEDEFKEQSTKASIYRSDTKGTENISGF
eukprot:NODE_2201_length_819_cov_51.976623_g1540_i0.p2 GENE.NODE_2201_length_819_cov_51.976623_g1540_i0~~NODE_2201_length_819_cov_51.976623_g1540_i0.p2  ORF type:complete len:131 (+),score=80.73 NODE_2201_length_819_cov_51.976623_g1540_i0:23-394(+)